MCVCGIVDAIKNIQSIIEGKTIKIGQGSIYIPDPERRAAELNKMSDEKRKEAEDFRLIEAPKFLKKYEEKLKEYVIEKWRVWLESRFIEIGLTPGLLRLMVNPLITIIFLENSKRR